MCRIGVLAAAVSLLVARSSPAELTGTLVVANKSGDSVSFIDLAREMEVARVPVGEAPHELAISPDGDTVLVGEYGSEEAHGSTVAILDVRQARVVGRIEVGVGTRPHSLAFLPGGERAVVTLQERDAVAIVDVARRSVLRVLPTGGRESHMVRLSPDGGRAYVTSRRGAGTLSVLSLVEEKEPTVIVTGAGAEGLSVTPDGREVWVLDREAGTISIVDTARLEVVERLESHPSSNRIAISQDGRAFITNGTSGTSLVQYLRIYDVGSRARLHELPLGGGKAASGAFGVLTHDDLTFVADSNGGRILAYGSDGGEPKVLITGRERVRPDGMVWSPRRVGSTEASSPVHE